VVSKTQLLLPFILPLRFATLGSRIVTEYLLSKFGLLDLINDRNRTEAVQVAVTFDGGKVSRFFGHVTGGFKLVDKHCTDPKSGTFLFGDAHLEKVQSHVHCFPIKIAFAKDTKDLYRVQYSDFFFIFKTI
jgi:hypothetical protein